MRAKLTRLLCLLLVGFCAGVSGAEVDDEPPISAGQMVQVANWDQKSHTFELIKTLYPAQGPNYVTIEDLAAAVTTINLKRVKHSPASIVGNEYKLDKAVKLQSVLAVMAKRGIGQAPPSKGQAPPVKSKNP